MTIYSFVRFDIINEMYENRIDEDIIKECGKKLSREGQFEAMRLLTTIYYQGRYGN